MEGTNSHTSRYRQLLDHAFELVAAMNTNAQNSSEGMLCSNTIS